VVPPADAQVAAGAAGTAGAQRLRVAVVAAHPDDAELGMGGTIARLIAEGHHVAVIDLTDGEPTPHGTKELRAKESAAASAVLGLTDRVCLDLGNRELQDTIANRKALAAELRARQTQIVFLHHRDDLHPDHLAAHDLTRAACFYSRIVKWDIGGEPWRPSKLIQWTGGHLKVDQKPDFLLDVTAHWDQRIAAIECYVSQFAANPANRAVYDLVRARAEYFGTLIGRTYAEGFIPLEPVGLSGLDALVM
jgi:bacillithiol biosynthesis deacetylase BshB1